MKRNYILLIAITIVLFTSCKKGEELPKDIDLRQEMRSFIIDISSYAKAINSDFIIIPQNGQALITDNGEDNGNVYLDYVAAIDATGREDLFYGYSGDNQETPLDDNLFMYGLCDLFEQNNIEVLVTDYCSDQHYVDNSYYENEQAGFISFAANERNLNEIPTYPTPIFNENNSNITEISQAKNFLYIINSENYSTKQDFLDAISTTNYDLVLIDLYHNEEIFSIQEITQLKTKNNGSSRLVIAYMSIGEAEDYRYYWNADWESNDKPNWMEPENPAWAGNYKVRYWAEDWQDIIFGNQDSYLKKILDAGFDGVYLDIIDGYEYFEDEY